MLRLSCGRHVVGTHAVGILIGINNSLGIIDITHTKIHNLKKNYFAKYICKRLQM